MLTKEGIKTVKQMENKNKQGFAVHPENINRNGRPKKGQTMTDILSELGDIQDIELLDEKITKKKALALKIWQLALKGDLAAIKYIYNRIDGMPRISQDITVNDKIEDFIEAFNNIDE